MSKDTFYFSHDYNVRNDIKIKKLINKHGFLGYGLFWAIIEDLYNNTNVLPMDYECIAFDLRTNPDVIKSIINDFDLFIIENDTFGSLSVERRLTERKEKSIKARESVLKRWNKDKKDTNVLQTNYDSNTIKERKGKEIKEKETKFNIKESLCSLGVSNEIINDYLAVRKLKKLANTETAFKKLVEEINKTELEPNEVIKICVEKSWGGFNHKWLIEEKEKSFAKKEKAYPKTLAEKFEHLGINFNTDEQPTN